jgi:hypothetical protein
MEVKTMRLDEEVLLVNKGNKFESAWNGRPFVIAKGKDKQVVRGLANHFIEKHPEAKLEIKDIEDEEVEPRQVKKDEQEEANAFEELEG